MCLPVFVRQAMVSQKTCVEACATGGLPVPIPAPDALDFMVVFGGVKGSDKHLVAH